MPETVEQHYTGDRLAERVLEAAAAAGLDPITPVALAPADEFHTRGLAATQALAQLAGIRPGERVIDVGSGLGGPARILASAFGADVTGIDLTPEFVRSAQVLTEACALSDRVRFHQGDALAMPFDGGAFDVAWTQHVVMNIADRTALYREVFRVLRPGGRFAFFDIVRGDGPELEFPVPWASDAAISHLFTPAETLGFVKSAGFEVQAWQDLTDDALGWMKSLSAGPPPGPLNLEIVMGAGMPGKLANLARSARAGSVRWLQAVLVKPV
ncbi:MAG: class I SAM-dependent methyltransferase [Dehalococcoidia bacterium]|nr:class I SAM-dependent methyltransferase [Dehalococcoidia bacterium]